MTPPPKGQGILPSSSRHCRAGESHGLCQPSPLRRSPQNFLKLNYTSLEDVPRSIPICVEVKTAMAALEDASGTEAPLTTATAPLTSVCLAHQTFLFSKGLRYDYSPCSSIFTTSITITISVTVKQTNSSLPHQCQLLRHTIPTRLHGFQDII